MRNETRSVRPSGSCESVRAAFERRSLIAPGLLCDEASGDFTLELRCRKMCGSSNKPEAQRIISIGTPGGLAESSP